MISAISIFVAYKLGSRDLNPEWLDRNKLVTDNDIQIIEATISSMSDSTNWLKKDDRICIPGDSQSLFCAIAFASKSIAENYDHRGVATQEVRFTIEELYPNRWEKHPIKDFNNHRETTFEEVHLVLLVTLKRCLLRRKDYIGFHE